MFNINDLSIAQVQKMAKKMTLTDASAFLAEHLKARMNSTTFHSELMSIIAMNNKVMDHFEALESKQIKKT